MNTARAGIIKSADIHNVFAKKITMLLLAKNAYEVSQHLEVINVAVAIVGILIVIAFFVASKPITK